MRSLRSRTYTSDASAPRARPSISVLQEVANRPRHTCFYLHFLPFFREIDASYKEKEGAEADLGKTNKSISVLIHTHFMSHRRVFSMISWLNALLGKIHALWVKILISCIIKSVVFGSAINAFSWDMKSNFSFIYILSDAFIGRGSFGTLVTLAS